MSWVLTLFAACFVAGVAAVLVWRVHWGVGIVAALFCVLCVVRFRYVWALPLLAVCGLLVGLGYGSAHAGSRDAYLGLVSQTVTIRAVLKEDFSKSSSGAASLQVSEVSINERGYPGTVLVTTRSPPPVKRGEIVYASGVIKPGFGSFPAVLGLATVLEVQQPAVQDTGRIARDWFADKVRTLIPEPQASLGIGFLTGQKSALPDDLFEALKIVGLTHIVVASGYNLTILVQLARRLLSGVSKYLSAVIASGMIVIFIAMTGLSPSMTRAGIVSGFSVLTWYYGRSFHPLILLLIVAGITVAFQPSFVWGDLGWQLSFAAFAGVMLVSPLLQAYFFGTVPPSLVRQLLGETIAAHVVTLPIIALSFGTHSNVAILANLLVVPFVPIAMLLTFISGLWAIVGLGWAWLVSAPTTWLLTYMTTVATALSELSWAQTTLTMPALVWAAYGFVLLAVCLWMWKASGHTFRTGEEQLY